MNKKHLIQIAGGLWILIGAFLLIRGVLMYQTAIEEQHATRVAVGLSVLAGLVLGSVKGQFVLAKSARRNKDRILSLEAPVRVHHIFSIPYYILIAGMIGLGIALRTWNQYLGGYIVVAAIYCAIGAALMVSSRIYWRQEPTAAAEEAS